MRKMVRSSGFGMFSLLGVIAVSAAIAQAVVTKSNTIVNFDGFTVNVPCANNGAGEDVVFLGNLHVLITSTINSGGGARFKFHFQPQGLSGIGTITGDSYQATGVTQETDVIGKVGAETTFVNNFRMIGQGPGNNFLVHETFHVTVNANGVLTVFFDKATTECK
jgi:hypothetical protein